MRNVTALLAGAVFGVGLIVSGMTHPAKILGFLDITGSWDPSLALVMAGAIAVASTAFLAAKTMPRSFSGDAMRLPAAAPVDRQLLTGSALFGVGWGLAGFCPGPALVAAASGQPKAMLFVFAMLAGMALFQFYEGGRRKTGPAAPASNDA